MAIRTRPFTKTGDFGGVSSGDLPISDLAAQIESFLLAGDIDRHSRETLTSRRARLTKFHWYLTEGPPATAAAAADASIGVAQVRGFLHYLSHGHEMEGGRWTNGAVHKQNFEPVSSGTVKAYHSTLRTFFNWLVTEEEIAASPMRKIPPPTDNPDQVQPFTDEQLRGMLGAARRFSRRDEAMFYVLLDTGIRATELCSLAIGDVDFSAGGIGQIRVRHGKGDKARSVPFSRDTKRSLYQYLRERGAETDSDITAHDEPLFVAERGPNSGGQLTRVGLQKMVRRWAVDAGIVRERRSPHTFRHTFAISFLRAGGNVFTLKEILGHTSLAIVNRYVAIAQADISRQHAQFSPVASFKATGSGKRRAADRD